MIDISGKSSYELSNMLDALTKEIIECQQRYSLVYDSKLELDHKIQTLEVEKIVLKQALRQQSQVIKEKQAEFEIVKRHFWAKKNNGE